MSQPQKTVLLDNLYIENLFLKYVTLRSTKGEIRQNYYFFAKLKDGMDDKLVSNEGKSKWFSLAEIKELEIDEQNNNACIGGHLIKAVISYTGEIVINPVQEGVIVRMKDDLTGISVWKL